MFHLKRSVLAGVMLAALLAVAAALRTASAQNPGLAPHPLNKLALAEDEVKQLILLMDTDRNGKISKKEFMAFMEAEFDRLDKDKSGELDPKELTTSQIRPARPAVGK
jgi:5S rRNA maturation endonuclease (ribonuclease M5)